jgi:dTDP-glucose 4,6-dehydratase
MHNVLVTGGAGFIGSNFVRYLLEKDPDVRIINLDALTYAGSLENLNDLPDPERHTFIRGNICDRALIDEVLRRYQIDTIAHFAAETHVDRSILGPDAFIQTNIVGTFTLLEASRRFWLEEKAFDPDEVRFQHVSTDEVFGTLGPADTAFAEETPYAPRSPYAASKAASDHIVRAYGITYGLPYTITNCSNNYGPYQFPEKLIPLMVLNAIEGRSLPIYGDGQQIRDWLFVEDHCEAILTVIKQGTPGETYCVGGDNQPPNMTVVKTICEILDECLPGSQYTPHESLIQFVKDRPGHDRRYDIDIAKIKRELDWQPRQSLNTGLLKTVKWYLDHPEWIEAIRKQQDYQGWLAKNYDQRQDTLEGGG